MGSPLFRPHSRSKDSGSAENPGTVGGMGRGEDDRALEALSDEELDILIERARQRASDLSEDEIAAIIAEGVRAVRAERRSS